MKERLSQIDSLKTKGIIGEDNQGYLAVVGADPSGQAIVDAENADRRIVYAALAKQTGASPSLVGRRRAQQLVSMAGPGEWIQDASGNWVKK